MSGIFWFGSLCLRRRRKLGADFEQCEKHAKKEEALEKLKGGAKFDEVAKEFSEDKARAGRLCGIGRRLVGFFADV